jgi:NDP-sugar pyrophosphorylase family protein
MHSLPDAIVLCGGAGSRLRPLTDEPKAMVSIGGHPFLEIILRQLRRWGCHRVILAVGYRAEAIQSYFGDEAFGLRLLYSPELIPLGTGGALRNAVGLAQSSTVLILNGDSYTDADLHEFHVQHLESKADMSLLGVPPDGREDCGTVSVSPSGRLLAFQEKQALAGPQYVNAGIYLVSRALLEEIPEKREVSLEKELLPQWLDQNKNITVIIDRATCHDIGTPERFRSAQTALAGVEMGSDPNTAGGGH